MYLSLTQFKFFYKLRDVMSFKWVTEPNSAFQRGEKKVQIQECDTK